MSNYCSLLVFVSEVSVASTGRGCDPVSRDPWYSQTRAWAFLQNRGDDLPLPLLHVVIAIKMVVHCCTYSILRRGEWGKLAAIFAKRYISKLKTYFLILSAPWRAPWCREERPEVKDSALVWRPSVEEGALVWRRAPRCEGKRPGVEEGDLMWRRAPWC